MLYFYVNERKDQDLTILDLEGSLCLGSSGVRFENILRRLSENGQKQIILNFSGISEIDAAGLGALIDAHQKILEAGGQLKICDLNVKVIELMTITKLLTIFDVFESERKATESFQIRRYHHGNRHFDRNAHRHKSNSLRIF